MPLRQGLRVATHIARQRLLRRDRFAILLELEPLFACNLKCAGCGKIQQPADVLRKRMPVEQALAAVAECGAPMVSIAGGEPLMHPQIDELVARLIARRTYVFLCTNALLVPRKLDLFRPSRYLTWVVHIDGLRERHDASVCRDGTFDEAVAVVRELRRRGFRVSTNTTFYADDTPGTVIEVLNYLNDELRVDEMMISPGYAYDKAPVQDNFLPVQRTKDLFRYAFANGNRRRWRLSHSALFLDFLEGRVDLPCTAWGIPSYSLLGWQRPCYLLGDDHVPTYRELVDGTDWDAYGRGRDARCSNCMAHCGHEPTAVLATMSSLKQSLRALAGR